MGQITGGLLECFEQLSEADAKALAKCIFSCQKKYMVVEEPSTLEVSNHSEDVTLVPPKLKPSDRRRAFVSAEDVFAELIRNETTNRILENARVSKKDFVEEMNNRFYL